MYRTLSSMEESYVYESVSPWICWLSSGLFFAPYSFWLGPKTWFWCYIQWKSTCQSKIRIVLYIWDFTKEQLIRIVSPEICQNEHCSGERYSCTANQEYLTLLRMYFGSYFMPWYSHTDRKLWLLHFFWLIYWGYN